MSLGRPLGYNNITNEFNSLYKITFDMSGWDRCVIQTVAPMTGRINLQGTNDGGGPLVSGTGGNAQLAINFSPIQAKDLSTGSMVNSIYGPGLFEVTFGAQYLRLQGSPAAAGTNVYRISLFDSKVS